MPFLAALALTVSLEAQPAAGLGRIVFPTSGPAEAQKHFIRGVLLLHSFEYRKAREEFLSAQKVAPAFAMAYWGEAMTYNEPVWFAQDLSAARAALKRLPANAPTERERAYLAAVEILYGEGSKESRDFAYATAMRRLHEKYPDDQEAAAFYALSLLGTCHQGRDFRTYMNAAAIAEALLAKNPEHPGALHYAIHSYDDPIHAPLGLRAGAPMRKSPRRLLTRSTCRRTSFTRRACGTTGPDRTRMPGKHRRRSRSNLADITRSGGSNMPTCNWDDLRMPGEFSRRWNNGRRRSLPRASDFISYRCMPCIRSKPARRQEPASTCLISTCQRGQPICSLPEPPP